MRYAAVALKSGEMRPQLNPKGNVVREEKGIRIGREEASEALSVCRSRRGCCCASRYHSTVDCEGIFFPLVFFWPEASVLALEFSRAHA